MPQCPYCGHHCKTDRGLTQHIERTAACRQAQTSTVGSQIGANTLGDDRGLQAQSGENGSSRTTTGRHRRHTRNQPIEERKQEVNEEQHLAPEEGHLACPSGSFEVAEEEDFFLGGPDASATDGEAGGSSGSTELEDEEANTSMLEDFREYCNTHDTKFEALDSHTIKSIKLMDILRRTKAPLNAYQPFLEWHLRETGHLRDATMTLKDTPKYFTRPTLMKRMMKRYKCEALIPKIRKVKLPFAKSVASIPVRNAKDVIVSLLTDPRVDDKDYLFFGDDPLAPPPDPVVHLEDLNTGDAFLKSHEAMIKNKGEVLLGVPMCIDGAVTGQFSDLPITAVKIALGIHTREHRDKEHAWRELGWIPQVRQQRARGRKLFQESGHMESQDLQLVDGEGEAAHVNQEAGSEDEEDKDEESDVKAQDFHTMLSTTLESFVDLQRTGFIWDLVYNGKLYKNIKFIIFVPFVKCDTEEADALCGRYKVRTGNVKQICRYCHCPTNKADDPRVTHKMKTQQEIQKLIDKGRLDKLKDLSQHNIQNAFYEVTFHQANDGGIHGACPSEMLHAILLGIFKYVREHFFQVLGPTSNLAEDINGLSKMYGTLLSRQSDRSLPNTNFSKGVQKGKLTGKEYRGVLLVMAAVVRSSKARELMVKKKDMGGEDGVTDWSRLIEMLLEWEAFLNLKKMHKADVKKLNQKHVFLMYMLRNVARRSEGMGLKIMKFHAIKHMVQDMLLYGTPSEMDTGSNESHHKPSKYAAKLTQRKEATFNLQTAQRMTEFLVLDLALSEIEAGRCLWEYFHPDTEAPLVEMEARDYDSGSDGDESESSESSDGEARDIQFRELALPESEDESSSSEDEADDRGDEVPEEEAEADQLEAQATLVDTGGSRIRVFEDPDRNNRPSFTMLTRSPRLKKETKWGIEIRTFLVGLQNKARKHLPRGELPIFTLHKRGAHIFHGHPNYRCAGPWRDWALFDWGAEGILPCHIWCFVRLGDMPTGKDRLEYGGVQLQDGVFAVVECAEYDDPEANIDRITDLFTPLSLITMVADEEDELPKRMFYLADTEAIKGTCIVVPDVGGPPNAYFEVKPRDGWAKVFLDWLKRPHKDDEMVWTDSEEEREREARAKEKKDAKRNKKAAATRRKRKLRG